jgi:hypothetical protein
VSPDSVITLIPADGQPGRSETAERSEDDRATSATPSASCGDDSFAVCPSTSRDPLAGANVRGSFQLVRERSGDESAGDAGGGLTLLRPNDSVDEIFVTGTLINADSETSACLTGLAIVFDFPRVVLDPETREPTTAPPEDFEVECFYVGVRSREASVRPPAVSGTSPDASNAAETAIARPPSCDEIVSLAMTDDGVTMRFQDDVALCPGCWLVGGRDGVLFSWKHRDDLAMSVRAGDAVGYAGARCVA